MIPKALLTLVRGLAAAAALLLLLVALAWAGVHWLIVPRIDDFRPQLAAWASRALDANVSMQQLSAQSSGWLPTLVVQGLAISDADGQPGLRAERASVRLSPWNLLRGRMDALDMAAPTVWLRRDAQGGIHAAGVALAQDAQDSGAALDWLLAQPRISLRGGQLHWVDAQHGHAYTLDAVNAELRGRGRLLTLSVDAGGSSGARLALAARLHRPAWPVGAGSWRHWGGRIQLDLHELPVAQLADALVLPPRWGVQLDAGLATLHVQGSASDGQLRAFDASLSLQQLAGRLGHDVQPLQLHALDGALRWRRQAEGAQVTLDDVQLAWPDGSSLTGASATLTYALPAAADAPMRLQASHVDLDALHQLARHLPLPPALQQALHELRPAGWLDTLDAQWLGPLRTTRNWQASGSVRELAVAARPAADDAAADDGGQTRVGRPGVHGLGLAFDATQAGGRATLRMDHGTLEFPGVFEEPILDVAQLLAQGSWRMDADGTRVDVDRLELANADAQGVFSGSWQTGALPPKGSGRYPGILDLRGTLSRGEGARVHRYLPLVLPADARHYVRDAIVQGRLSQVDVRVHGPLAEVPFNEPGEEGVFRIGGQVDDGIMAYVPARLQAAGEPAWPALHGLNGQLLFEGAGMHVRQASAQVQDHPGWTFDDIQADIADFDEARVVVRASGSGKLQTALDIVRGSPLAALTQHALDDAQGSGDTRLQLALDLPIEALGESTVRGQVELQQNSIQLGAAVPPLDAAQGSVAFTESGFSIKDVQARALGGAVTVRGGLASDEAGGAQPARIRARGSATAAGLQQMAGQLPLADWTPLTDALQGKTGYELALDMAAGGARSVALDSDLEGLAMDWPAPLHKPAAARWPLQLRWQRQGDEPAAAPSQLDLQLADRLALHWSWPQGLAAAPRGTLQLGAATGREAPVADSGWTVDADLATLDVDRWTRLVRPLAQAADQHGSADRWFPDSWRIAVRNLRAAGHELADVSAQGQREGRRWASHVDSPDLEGNLTYQQGAPGQPGQLDAQLSRLRVRAARQPGQDVIAASELPSMAIKAETLVWNQLDLGRLELHASHVAADAEPGWRMDSLVLATPQARLQAQGKSRTQPGENGGATTNQTTLRLELAVDDAGVLLQRLGQPGVMAGGTGSVVGELAWLGSPLAPQVPALTGKLKLDLSNGRFLKLEPGASKLFGVLSLQALPRRFMLDFRDVFQSGFAYDHMHAETRLDHGILHADKLQIRGVSAIIDMSGQADLQKKTQDLHVRVQPRLDAGAAALAASAVSPALGAAAFVAQLALKGPLGKANAREFHISGSWSDPQVGPLTPSPQDQEESSSHEDRMPAAGENNP